MHGGPPRNPCRSATLAGAQNGANHFFNVAQFVAGTLAIFISVVVCVGALILTGSAEVAVGEGWVARRRNGRRHFMVLQRPIRLTVKGRNGSLCLAGADRQIVVHSASLADGVAAGLLDQFGTD